jgi:presenilin-like A22 family membrane protease
MTNETLRSRIPTLVMLAFLVLVQVLAVAFMPAIIATDERVFEHPESTANPILYIILILLFTSFILIAIKFNMSLMIKAFILISIAASIFYILNAFVSPFVSIPLTLAMLLLLRFYPEWYIIDAVGVFICAGISTLFGVSMTTLPVVLLLIILAVYDAISVYKTKHMVVLAEGVLNIKAPLLFVVPKSRNYSFRTSQVTVSDDKGKPREAYFLGLGDAIIPTILVISANWALLAPVLPGLGVNLPALGAMIGTYLGFLALMMTSRDKPQAGLPFLNSGVVLGFLIGCAFAGVRPF